MSKVTATRMELLARKQQLELAEQGRNLLEKKRTALMQEIMQIADIVLEDDVALKNTADQARLALARAEASAGFEEVRSAALATKREFPLEIDFQNIMGVRAPRIRHLGAAKAATARGYALSSTPKVIDEAAEAFENEIDAILRLADSELRLKSLLSEIQRTSRRLNAIEQVLIPRLHSEYNFIQMSLNERERSDQFRLKLARRLLDRRRGVTR